MSAWSDAVEFAVKRSQRDDAGAVAAREGILGLPASQTGKTAQRCYEAAAAAREDYQRAMDRRKRPRLPAGTTGKPQWDTALQPLQPA